MPDILDFPVELLINIINLVPEPIALVPVCQKFRALATPLAYRSLSLSRAPDWPHSWLESCNTVKTLELLLRSMVGRPSLGAYVRHLAVPFNYSGESTGISLDIRAFAVKAARLHGVFEEIPSRIAANLPGITFFLLLCYFPSLESLAVEICDDHINGFFDLVASSPTLPCGLQSVRSVELSYGDTEGGISQQAIFPLFRLPFLRTLVCGMINIGGPSYDNVVLFGGASRIESIMILGAVEAWALAAMVRSMPALRSFSYYHAGASVGFAQFPGPSLGHALRTHALHQLEELDVTTELEEAPTYSIGPLLGFTKLERLSLTITILLGSPPVAGTTTSHHLLSELLPSSLISLTLYGDPDWKDDVYPKLAHLLRIEPKGLPNLKQLSIFRRDVAAFHAGDLPAACLDAGIKLVCPPAACVNVVGLRVSHLVFPHNTSLVMSRRGH